MRYAGIHLKISAAVILCGAMLGAYSVRANVSTSTSFGVRDGAITEGGGESTSTNFGALGSLGSMIVGTATSTNFEMQSGPIEFDSFDPRSQNWRWYGDEANETPLSALAAENTAPSNITDQDVIKLRLTIKETAGIGENNVKFKLQYSKSSDFAGVTDVTEIGTCTGSSGWCYADASGTDNGIILSKVLTDSDACSGALGDGCGTHNESGANASALTHVADAAAEYEFTIKPSGAQVGSTYFFRAYNIVDDIPVAANGGETYPSLTTAGATLTFLVSGLSEGTAAEGITTDVDSTATTVPFGALLFGTEKIAAQRLTVSTNASQGYQIFVFQNQNFLNETADQIPGVSALNSSPAGWNTACAASLSGCIGYHAGEDILSGGSTRFTANDTYARLEPDLREIAYSSAPAASRSTDIIFRSLARTHQPRGDYEMTIQYVAVPVF